MKNKNLPFLCFLVFLLTVSLTGCSIFSSKKIEPKALESYKEEIALEKGWVFSSGYLKKDAGINILPSSKIFDDELVIYGMKKKVFVIDLNSGETIKEVQFEEESVSAVGYRKENDERFFSYVSLNGDLVFFSEQSGKLWTIPLTGIVRTAPKIGDLGIIVREENNRIVSYARDSGKLLWSVSKRGPPLILHAQSDMEFIRGNSQDLDSMLSRNLAVNMAGGFLLFLNPKTGFSIWDTRLAFPKGQNEVERIVDLIGTPKLDDEEICSSVYQTKVSCIDKGSGIIVWEKEENVFSPAFFSFPYVVTVNSNDEIKLHNREKDNLVWVNKKLRFRGVTSVVIWNEIVWAIDSFGFVHGLSLISGSYISRYRVFGNNEGNASLVNSDHGLLVINTSGKTVMLRKRE